MKLLAGAVAVLTVVAGCGSPTETTEETRGEVVIALENWAGYEANAAVLGYLLKNELGYDVTYQELGGDETWEALEAGTIDVIAEDWGKFDVKAEEEPSARDYAQIARYTGVDGQIGWWMPKWVKDEYPGIEKHSKLAEYVDVLQTSKSKGKVQLLVGDDDYVSSEKEIIANLNLPVEVVSVGSEEKLIEAARDSVNKKEPVLFYFWQPHWLFTEMDLVPVEFPEYDAKDKDCTEKKMCGYGPLELNTVVSKDFAKNGGDAFRLIKNFAWSSDDQSQVAFDITEAGMSPEDAAKKWLDLHSDLWQTWITA
ncbi:glycine betaine ABC transporter substrate-binding protein [Stackebrandtia soli]|uniref:glycine betaine ABC transporter substrate-binding protein n=1 Tax=Stackebrandtia soli TaxID=1892856 RepID=UPI0039E791D5